MQRTAIAIVITLALASLGLGAWMLSGVPSHREGPRAAEGNAIVAGAVTLPVESAPGPRTNVEAAAPSASAAPTDAAPTDAAIDDPRPVSDSADPVPLLSGSVVFPQGFTRAMFRVAFRRPDDQTTLPIHLAADGAFRLFRAAPGMVSVLVELRDDPPPLATILDVELPSVGTNADPRLQHLAFPDLRQLTLRVVDEVGAPIAAQIGVLAFTPGTDQGRRWFRQGGAAITVPARHRPQRVQVWSTGREAVELDVDDKATVMLPRAAVVAFHFRVDPALLERHGFRLGLRPRGGRLDAVEFELTPEAFAAARR